MTVLRSVLLAVIVVLFGAASMPAQSKHTAHTLKLDDADKMPKASIDQLAWLAGSWHGDAFGGKFEEVWSPPSAKTMMGMYKLMQRGQTTMYEMQMVVEDKESLVLKLKHFNPDFSGWEEKDKYVSFPLVRLAGKKAEFAGLTFELMDENTMRVFLATKGRDGKLSEHEFRYRRRKP